LVRQAGGDGGGGLPPSGPTSPCSRVAVAPHCVALWLAWRTERLSGVRFSFASRRKAHGSQKERETR
jgi:hypothetical protein